MKAWIISGMAVFVVVVVVVAVSWGYHMEALAAQQQAELQHVAAQQTVTAQQTATAVAQQTAQAEAQQTAVASVHQTAVAQKTADVSAQQTVVAVNAEVQQTAAARQTATAEAQQVEVGLRALAQETAVAAAAQDTAVAQQTANAAVQQTVAAQQTADAVAQLVANADAQRTAVAQQIAGASAPPSYSGAQASVSHTYTNVYQLAPTYYDSENLGTPNDSWPLLVPGSVVYVHVEVDGGDGNVRLTAYDGGTSSKIYKWGIQQAPFDTSAIVPSSGALVFDVSNDFDPFNNKTVTVTYQFQTVD